MLRKMFRHSWQANSLLVANKHVKQLRVNAINEGRMFSDDFEYEPPIKITHPNITLSQFGGYAEIVNKMRQLTNYTSNRAAYEKMGARLPSGILLEGPSGTGKSFLAQAFAGETGHNFIRVGASDLLHPHVNGTQKIIANLFRIARLHAPCVLCFDEIDSIATQRVKNIRDSNDSSVNNIVNKLLTELEQPNLNVFIIATTNNFDVLDPAIIRAGRFDRHIHIPMPTNKDRLQILNILLDHKPIDAKVQLPELAQISHSFSGAQLAMWVNEAAILAVQQKQPAITREHFEIARLDLLNGYERQEKTSKKNRYNLALHEASHALVGHLIKLNQFHQISMRQRGNVLGFTERKFSNHAVLPTKQKCLDFICAKLAGRAGEIVFAEVTEGSGSDIDQATNLARHMVKREGMGNTISGMNAEQNIEEILQSQMQRAIRLLKKNETQLKAIAERLMQQDVIDATEFKAILLSTKTKPNFFNQSVKIGQESVLATRLHKYKVGLK